MPAWLGSSCSDVAASRYADRSARISSETSWYNGRIAPAQPKALKETLGLFFRFQGLPSCSLIAEANVARTGCVERENRRGDGGGDRGRGRRAFGAGGSVDGLRPGPWTRLRRGSVDGLVYRLCSPARCAPHRTSRRRFAGLGPSAVLWGGTEVSAGTDVAHMHFPL